MRLRQFISASVAALSLITAALALQRGGFRQYLDEEDNPAPLPADAGEKT